MKISGVSSVYGAYQSAMHVAPQKMAKTETKKDVVAISGEGKDFQSVIKALAKTPDIRADKVAEMTKKYEKNGYQVSNSALADKILNGVV